MAETEAHRAPSPAFIFSGDGAATSRSVEAMLAETGSLALVNSELCHRFRNLVTVAQSLVVQTLHDGAIVAEARETLNQRLAAMGQAVDLLLQTDWQQGSLRATIREALALHTGFHGRIHCDGPDVELGSNAVLSLTLALHELGTNAIKYGALSVASGSVHIRWKIVGDGSGPSLWLQWSERDGPPVRPPTRQGFGSRLISGATGRALGGEVELSYEPTGVTWLLVAPLGGIAQ